jgi:hypothetical protein
MRDYAIPHLVSLRCEIRPVISMLVVVGSFCFDGRIALSSTPWMSRARTAHSSAYARPCGDDAATASRATWVGVAIRPQAPPRNSLLGDGTAAAAPASSVMVSNFTPGRTPLGSWYVTGRSLNFDAAASQPGRDLVACRPCVPGAVCLASEQ